MLFPLLSVQDIAAPDGCEEGNVRLVGGANLYEGRLEVCVNRVWGTVCDAEWGAEGTNVVCEQLSRQQGQYKQGVYYTGSWLGGHRLVVWGVIS